MYGAAVLLTLLYTFFEISNGFTSDSLKIKLNHGGVLVGRHYVTVKGRHMRAFMGIPYVKPPIGELRFKVSEKILILFYCRLWFGSRLYMQLNSYYHFVSNFKNTFKTVEC